MYSTPQKTQTAQAGLFALRRPFLSSSFIVLRDGGGRIRGKTIFTRSRVVNIRTRALRNHRDANGLQANRCIYGTILLEYSPLSVLVLGGIPCTQSNVGQSSR